MSKNYEQTGTSADSENHCVLLSCVWGPVLNASQLLILLLALFLVSLFPGGILLHLFSCYVLRFCLQTSLCQFCSPFAALDTFEFIVVLQLMLERRELKHKKNEGCAIA